VVAADAAAAAADNREEDVGARSAARTGAVASDTPPAADGADDKTGVVVVDAVRLPRVVSVLGVAHVHSVVEEGAGNNTAVVVVRPPPGHHGRRSHAAGTVASEAGDGALRDSAVEEAADSVDGVVVVGTATVDRAAAAADNTDQNHCDGWDWSEAAAPGEDRPPDLPIVPPDETMRRPRGVAEHRPVLRPSDGADDAVRVDAAAEEEEGVRNTDAESPRSSDLLLMRTW